MTHELVKIKVIVLTTGVTLLLAGAIFLVSSVEVPAAPMNCVVDPKLGQQDCETVQLETPRSAVEELKQETITDTVFASEGSAILRETGNDEELVTLAPLPPAAMLFGGAIVGLIYLGRRRKVKAVQED